MDGDIFGCKRLTANELDAIFSLTCASEGCGDRFRESDSLVHRKEKLYFDEPPAVSVSALRPHAMRGP